MRNSLGWSYRLVRETVFDPLLGEYRTYGIQVEQRMEYGRKETGVIHDVTLEEERAQKLVRLFNQYRLSPIHIREVLDDLLP